MNKNAKTKVVSSNPSPKGGRKKRDQPSASQEIPQASPEVNETSKRRRSGDVDEVESSRNATQPPPPPKEVLLASIDAANTILATKAQEQSEIDEEYDGSTELPRSVVDFEPITSDPTIDNAASRANPLPTLLHTDLQNGRKVQKALSKRLAYLEQRLVDCQKVINRRKEDDMKRAEREREREREYRQLMDEIRRGNNNHSSSEPEEGEVCEQEEETPDDLVVSSYDPAPRNAKGEIIDEYETVARRDQGDEQDEDLRSAGATGGAQKTLVSASLSKTPRQITSDMVQRMTKNMSQVLHAFQQWKEWVDTAALQTGRKNYALDTYESWEQFYTLVFDACALRQMKETMENYEDEQHQVGIKRKVTQLPWYQQEPKDALEQLKRYANSYNQQSGQVNADMLEAALQNLMWDMWTGINATEVDDLCNQMISVFNSFPEESERLDEQEAVKRWIHVVMLALDGDPRYEKRSDGQKSKHKPSDVTRKMGGYLLELKPAVPTFAELRKRLRQRARQTAQIFKDAIELGARLINVNESASGPSIKKHKELPHDTKWKTATPAASHGVGTTTRGAGGRNKSLDGTDEACHVCGIHGHAADGCWYKNKPDTNVDWEKCCWKDSAIGKEWKKAGRTVFDPHVSLASLLESKQHKNVNASNGNNQGRGNGGRGGGRGRGRGDRQQGTSGRGELLFAATENLHTSDNDRAFLTGDLLSLTRQCQQVNVRVLVDSGAIHANVIDEQLASKIIQSQNQEVEIVRDSSCSTKICSLVGDKLHCECSKGTVTLILKLLRTDEQPSCDEEEPVSDKEIPGLRLSDDGQFMEITLTFTICSSPRCDVIVGLPDIRRYDLTRRLRNHFVVETRGRDELDLSTSLAGEVLVDSINQSEYEAGKGSDKKEPPKPEPLPYSQESRCMISAAIYQLKDLFNNNTAGEEAKEEEVFWKGDILDFLPRKNPITNLPRKQRRKFVRQLRQKMKKTKQVVTVAATVLDETQEGEDVTHVLPTVIGEGEFFDQVRQLIRTYADVFSETVAEQPSRIPPMELRLTDESKWRVPSNRQPPRTQSLEREAALKKLINELEDHKVISKSQATHYSQVHLVPKPSLDGTIRWRLCIDYRALNLLLEGMGWPIPHIRQLLQRMGHRKARYFAVLDLTSGYHQVALSMNSRELAAFITPFGVYVPNRISMGLKSAPSYFQKEMATVLGDLLYIACELYIDDIIIFGNTKEEFLNNLAAVLERLRQHGITLHPKKARLALEVIEVLGHVMDKCGITMSEDKIGKVMDFPDPATGKELKSFLGLANYFRPHIPNYGQIARPLEAMVANYQQVKRKRLAWSDETKNAYNDIKVAISTCQKLYFMDDTSPIFLDTDASDYGIGAHLYQMVLDGGNPEGLRHSIAFMSKSLTGSQKNWSTIEKECFAIYSALREWEYLLRDRFFTIRTDHKNLRYLNENTPKVVRWKLAVQEFNFQVEYVEGPKNVVADAFSRVVEKTAEDLVDTSILEEEQSSIEQTGDQQQQDVDNNDHQLLVAAVTRQRNEQAEEENEVEDDESSTSEEEGGGEEKIKSKLNNPRRKGSLEPNLLTRAKRMLRELHIQSRASGMPIRPPQHHRVEPPLSEQIMNWLHMVHNSIVGHKGVERMMENLKRLKKQWPRMRQHCREYIRKCPLCQKMKDIKTVINASSFTTASYQVMSRLNMDSIGPLPADSKGNEYILVIIDCFSRFVELYPIPSTEATYCAQALTAHIGRYGIPQYLMSDKGSQFVNEVIESLTKLWATWNVLSIAYSKEENAIVERSNKEVMRHLRAFVYDSKIKSNWSLLLPLVQRIMNTSEHRSLGVSPAQLLFGNSLDLDRGLFPMDEKLTEPITPTVKKYIDTLLTAQAHLLEIAQSQQFDTDMLHLKQTTNKGKTEFPVNSYVLLRYPMSLGGDHRPPSKLHTKWRGPYRVVSFEGSSYFLQNLVTKKTSNHHIKELVSFQFDPQRTNPEEVAYTDEDYFEIDHIVKHRGKTNRVSTLQFLVSWKGQPPSENTWEEWKTIRTTAKLHEYLRSKNLARLIPKQFQEQEGPQIA